MPKNTPEQQAANQARQAAAAAGQAKKADDHTQQITQAYQSVLGRAPDPGGLANYQNLLKAHGSSFDLLGALKASDEYKQKQSGGGGGGAAGGGGAGGGGTGFNVTAQTPPDFSGFMDQYKKKLAALSGQTNPNLQTQVDRLGERLSADTTERATNLASGRIRDQASGAKSAAEASMARRGIVGGAAEQRARQIDAAAQRAAAGATADIQLGRERDLDALTLGGQRIMEAPGQFALERDRAALAGAAGGMSSALDPSRLAISQGQLGLDASRLASEQARRQEDDELSLLMAMAQLGGGGGGYTTQPKSNIPFRVAGPGSSYGAV